MTRTAAIIGGGIGGLATAAALHRRGWRVELFERDRDLPETGTALGMWPAAMRALDELGVGEEVRARAARQETGAFRRPDGRLITSMTVDGEIFLLSRPVLLRLLHEAASGAELHFGRPVGGLRPYTNEFDLVVVADGVFSAAREEISGIRARYSGVTAWRGSVDGIATTTFTEVWGVGGKFGVTPQEGGRTNWYATVTAPEGSRDPGAERGALRRHFGGWADPVRTVLDAITEDGILRHDVYVTPRLSTFVHGNVALLGDAAHAMTPDLGRGACEALIDAVALARALESTENVANGLHGYDRERRRTTQRVAAGARAASQLVRMRHGLWLRDGLLRAASAVGP